MKFLLLLLPIPFIYFYLYPSYEIQDIIDNPSLIEYQYAASTQECLHTYIAFSKINNDNITFSSTKDALLYLQSISPRNELFVSTDKKSIVITSAYLPLYFFKTKEDCLSSVSYIKNKY